MTSCFFMHLFFPLYLIQLSFSYWITNLEIDGPQQVEVKDITDSSALISWSQPVAPMDGITMFYMPSSDPSDENRVDISPPDKQYSIDGLRPDTEYTVSLISRSGDITSDPVTATFTTGCLVIITVFSVLVHCIVIFWDFYAFVHYKLEQSNVVFKLIVCL